MDLREMTYDSRRLHKIIVDKDKCMGCTRCIRVCDYGVYKWHEDEKFSEGAYSEDCTGCMQCMYYCPAGAISIEKATLAFYDPLYDPLGLND